MDAATLTARARELAPVMAERAAEAERLRRLPDQTIADLRDADFFRAVVSTERGGHGLSPSVIPAVATEFAQGCVSTGWVTGFFMVHNWLVAQFPDSAQDEVLVDGYVLAPAALSPTATATPVEGGYTLSGRSPWATGIHHCNWVMLTGMVHDAAGAVVDARMFMLPLADVMIDEVWHTDGMRGTGSDTIVTEGAFVPAHRSISMLELANPASGVPFVPLLAAVAAAPAVGAAIGAVDAFADRIRTRVLAYTLGQEAKERPVAQMRIGRARADVDTAEALLDRTVRETLAGPLDPLAIARLRLGAAKAVEVSRTAIADCCAAAGGSVHFVSEPLQRFQRDVNTLSGHAIFDLDRAAESYGRLAVGLPSDPMQFL
ncbi:MAG: acyl-CoA dehydrogenase [Acidimicrobiales bacterium]|nr:acyl-CoA dehydrogenase [Acidimicrobiales bacterium]